MDFAVAGLTRKHICTNLSADLTVTRANEMEKAFTGFSQDLQRFETATTALVDADPPLGR